MDEPSLWDGQWSPPSTSACDCKLAVDPFTTDDQLIYCNASTSDASETKTDGDHGTINRRTLCKKVPSNMTTSKNSYRTWKSARHPITAASNSTPLLNHSHRNNNDSSRHTSVRVAEAIWIRSLNRTGKSISSPILLLFLIATIFHGVSGLEVPVAVIVDQKQFPLAKDVFNKALENLRQDPKYTVELTLPNGFNAGVDGCGTGLTMGNGASALFDDYYRNNIKAVFGPTCYRDLEIAGRATEEWDIMQFNIWQDHPSDILKTNIAQMTTKGSLNIGYNIQSFISVIGWTKVAFFICKDCYDDSESIMARVDAIASFLKTKGSEILYRGIVTNNWTDVEYMDMMNDMKTTARIFIPFLGASWDNYIKFATAANKSELPRDEYVVIYPMIYFNYDESKIPWINNEEIKMAFRGSILVFNNFFNPIDQEEVKGKLNLDNIDRESLLFYLQLYEAVYVYAWTIGRIPSETGTNDFTGTMVRKLLTEESVAGPFGDLYFAPHCSRLSPFEVKYVRPDNGSIQTFAQISIVPETPCSDANSTEATHCYTLAAQTKLDDTTYSQLPQDVPTCGFKGEMCDQTGTVVIVCAVATAIGLAVLVFLIVRKVKSGETASMPWAIPFASVKMVDVDSQMGSQQMSVHSLQQNIDDKSPRNVRELMRSRHLATIDQAYVVIESYNLREKLVFDKNEMHWLYLMKQIVHDNLNPFMGLCFDKSSHLYVMWSHCFRGSLGDMIFEVKKDDDTSPAFDKNFKGAFVRDLLKGLDFIHSSSLQYHGMLTPSHCLIDSHWILKLSGFGMSRMLYKWKNSSVISTIDGNPLIPNSELHYYAPEFRRALKGLMYTNRNEHIQLTPKQGQSVDMFAFGMVLFEILFRQKVCEIDDGTAADEDNLILCEQAEASVPVYPTMPDTGDVHPDLVGLMHKCWNGQPEQRPDATLARKITDATLKMSGSLVDQMIKNMEQYTNNLENLVKERTGQLEKEQEKAESLLTELLPKSVADELKVGRRVDPKTYKSATILYSDIVGFTSLCSESEPMEVVALLSGMFQKFDKIISEHNCYKCETIGDAYMVASGVPIPSKIDHVKDIASVALQQKDFLQTFEIPHRPGQYLKCRWGFNTGPVFTGVVGISAPRYMVFGQSVSIAAKMENCGVPNKIQMSLKSFQLLQARFPEYKCSARGSVKIEGIGTLLTYWLDGVEELLKSDAESFRAMSDKIEEEEREKRERELEKEREEGRRLKAERESLREAEVGKQENEKHVEVKKKGRVTFRGHDPPNGNYATIALEEIPQIQSTAL